MKNHRRSVLIKPSEMVAATLRADPASETNTGWYLVGVGELERARVFSQTANRIRKGELEDFPRSKSGWFEATSTADQGRKDKIAPVELYARFCTPSSTA